MPIPDGKATSEDWKRLSELQLTELIQHNAREFWPLIYHYVEKKCEYFHVKMREQEERLDLCRRTNTALRSVNSRLKNTEKMLEEIYRLKLKRERQRVRRELWKKYCDELSEVDFENQLMRLEREGFKRKLASIYDIKKGIT